MILKNIDPKNNPTKAQEFGDKAESQMAHYLMRAYGESNDIHVINDLRLEVNGDAAQIDHLIIHRFGFILVESKSVSGQISINSNSEWARQYSDNIKGMSSPIMQAQRQAEFLKGLLSVNSKNLLRKSLFLKLDIKDFKFDVLVAISDNGIINRDKNIDMQELYKADQITNEISNLISNYEKTNKQMLSIKINHFAGSTVDRITTYLIHSHKPKNSKNIIAEEKANYKFESSIPKQKIVKSNTQTDISDYSCKECHSKNINIIYGRFGYYFKCDDCEGSTSIKLKCNKDSCNPRLRKSKEKFHQECSSCGSSHLYHTNKATENA